MTDNNPNQDENIPVLNEEQNEDLLNCPFIKEISYTNGVKKVKITTLKAMYIPAIIFIALDVLEICLIYWFYTVDLLFIGILTICVVTIPLIVFLFIPIGINCEVNYNSANFTYRAFPVFPITYCCSEKSISFNEINNFYLFKFRQFNKKNYKIGINKKDGTDVDLVFGQDTTRVMEFDPKLELVPKIMNNWLVNKN